MIIGAFWTLWRTRSPAHALGVRSIHRIPPVSIEGNYIVADVWVLTPRPLQEHHRTIYHLELGKLYLPTRLRRPANFQRKSSTRAYDFLRI